MRDPFTEDQNSLWIPFADFLAGVLAIFLVASILMVFHLNDPKQKNQDAQIKSPGTIMIEAFWKEDVDVDVWVQSPQDRPVGYSRKQGKYMDLLRDDLGFQYDIVGGMHHENAFARQTPMGEYAVNLHMYSVRNGHLPIAVEVNVQIVKSQNEVLKTDIIKRVISTTVNLVELGQESTVVRFSLDAEGNLIGDSINHDPIKLREQK